MPMMSVANHSSSDAYVTFDLPSPGSAPAVSDDEVAALCLRWFEDGVHVRHTVDASSVQRLGS